MVRLKAGCSCACGEQWSGILSDLRHRRLTPISRSRAWRENEPDHGSSLCNRRHPCARQQPVSIGAPSACADRAAPQGASAGPYQAHFQPSADASDAAKPPSGLSTGTSEGAHHHPQAQLRLASGVAGRLDTVAMSTLRCKFLVGILGHRN
jgi:hypothetical protein